MEKFARVRFYTLGRSVDPAHFLWYCAKSHRGGATVVTAQANGDLARRVTVGARGEFDDLKRTLSTMLDRFAYEVTRITREIGTEGRFGGQAEVPGLSGSWQDLIANVNHMAENLTCHVRDIAKTTRGVSLGDLRRW